MDSNSLVSNWFNVSEVWTLIDSQSVIYLVLAMALFWVGKWVNNRMTPYNLNEQLTQHDNKAVSLSFAGYILAIGIILWGILGSPSTIVPTGSYAKDLMKDLGSTAIWAVVGIALLQAARILNNKILLSQFDNYKELVQDQNIGTGAVQCGAYIGSALIIRAALSGEESGGFLIELISTLVYFILGQIAFILFSKVYQFACRFDLHKEIEQDNASAGVGFGITLVAIGILLSGYIVYNDSLIGLAVWFVIGVFFMVVCRYLVDRLILPGSLLDDEIQKDRNWGAALIEGGAALGLAMILTSLFV